MATPANASSGATYLVDYPSGNHGKSAGIAFADGHSIVHKWQDNRTFTPEAGSSSCRDGAAPRQRLQTPDDPDCLYLASITSAHN